MNIPSAEVARKSFEDGEYKKAQEQAAIVSQRINAAIANGQKQAGGEGFLEDPVKSHLECLGYKVSNGSQMNESYWSVSW